MTKWYIDQGPESDVVLSCRIRLARNFAEFPYPHRSLPETRRHVMDRVVEVMMREDIGISQQFRFIDFTRLPVVERQVLVEKHLVSKELAESKIECGAIISDSENISIMLNEEDHLRIQCLGAGLQLDELWTLADRIDNLLSRSIDFAYDNKFGYLTCCPTNIGTAIRASAMLHLPALVMTGYIKGILESITKLGVAVRGMFGENTETTGNIFQISNQVTLGRTESDIVSGVRSLANQIVGQERELRRELFQQNGIRLVDRIHRSYGVLRNARIISAEETLQKLSDVRLGVNLGLLPGIDETRLNALMVDIQPGNIQQKLGRALRPDDRDTARANLVREVMLVPDL
jgi:protein arginine kinase